jgi:hypothetical protein
VQVNDNIIEKLVEKTTHPPLKHGKIRSPKTTKMEKSAHLWKNPLTWF